MISDKISRRKLAEFLTSSREEVWVGDYGYDTRPVLTTYVNCRRVDTPAPVAHTVGYADGRRDEDVPAGDVLRWLDSAPKGACIHIPDYIGCSYRGEQCFRKDRVTGQWVDVGYWDEWDRLVSF